MLGREPRWRHVAGVLRWVLVGTVIGVLMVPLLPGIGQRWVNAAQDAVERVRTFGRDTVRGTAGGPGVDIEVTNIACERARGEERAFAALVTLRSSGATVTGLAVHLKALTTDGVELASATSAPRTVAKGEAAEFYPGAPYANLAQIALCRIELRQLRADGTVGGTVGFTSRVGVPAPFDRREGPPPAATPTPKPRT